MCVCACMYMYVCGWVCVGGGVALYSAGESLSVRLGFDWALRNYMTIMIVLNTGFYGSVQCW